MKKSPTKKPSRKNTFKSWLKANRTPLIVFLVYLVITFIAIQFHESWEDEAQAWLTVRDCSLLELFDRMKYEGHFLPWYLLIMPFAKLGLPFATINYVSWLITAASVWLMLKHLPLRFYQRVIFVFTLPVLYFFPVVARCYCLLPLAIILLIMFHKDRYEKPFRYCLAIALAALVHTHCLMFAFIVGVDFVWGWFKQHKSFSQVKNRRLLLATLIPVFLVGASCLLLVGSFNKSSGFSVAASDLNVAHALMNSISENLTLYASFLPATVGFFAFALVFSLLALFRWQVFARVSVAVFWQYLVQSLVFSIPLPQRMFLPFFFLLFFLCTLPAQNQTALTLRERAFMSVLLIAIVAFSGSLIFYIITTVFLALAFTSPLVRLLKLPVDSTKYRRLVTPIFALLALVSVVDCAITLYNEIRYTYTDSKATAEFIKTELLSNDSSALFLTDIQTENVYTAIIAYLETPAPSFYDLYLNNYYTYGKLTYLIEDNEAYEADFDFCRREGYEHCYYIYPFNPSEEKDAEILFSSAESERKIDRLITDGKLKVIYDSVDFDDSWDLAAYEHFRIYEVMI